MEPPQNKKRVIVMLKDNEKAALKTLASDDGRSMSSFLRYLLLREIEAYSEPRPGYR